MKYKPWGGERDSSGTMRTTFRFTGQRVEASLGGTDGLYYYGARWYDSYLNRFISADTLIPNPGNVLDWDRFAAMRNNPLKYTDPTGHFCEMVGSNEICSADPDSNGWYIPVPININDIFINLKYPDAKYAADHVLSPEGLEFIKQQEGYYGYLYNDGNKPTDPYFGDTTGLGQGNCTIGYGHLVHRGVCSGLPSESVFTNGISIGDATNILINDLYYVELGIRDLVDVPITQHQYDALVSLAFNWGIPNLKKSDKIRLLNQRDYLGVGLHFLEGPHTSNGVRMPGLVRRRALESAMFLSIPRMTSIARPY